MHIIARSGHCPKGLSGNGMWNALLRPAGDKALHLLAAFTISVGVGTLIPGYQDESVDFINSVDQRLYQAKQQGRNCIISGT